MKTRIGRRLLRLIIVPLSGLVLLLGILAVVEIEAMTTQNWLRHSSIVIELSQQVALTLARDDVARARGSNRRPTAATMRDIGHDFATLHDLVTDDPRQTERLDIYARTARAHADRPTDTMLAARLERAERAFDRVEAEKQRTRTSDIDRLRGTLLVTLSLAAAVVIFLTVRIYRTLALSIARRLEALSANTQSFATGQPVGPPDTGDDEIGDVDARFRLVYDLLADREAAAARYRILAEQTSDIMLFLDGGQIVEANEAAANAYGYTRDELRSLTIYDLRIPELHDELRAIFERPEDHNATYETIHRRRDGTQFAVEIAMRQASIGGRKINCIVARDVSLRRETDARLRAAVLAANEASRLKSEFVATMSHEIRTPMNAVLGMTELLLGTSLDNEQNELAKTVHESGSSLLRIIDDILDFSKIEAGRLDIEARAFGLTACVESVAQLLSSQAQRKGLVFTAFVPPELPALLMGDDLRIRQILTNLVGNAMKFTAAGSVSIVVSTVTLGASSLTVRFAVNDTGIGIDPAAAAKLFTAFSQADGSITRRYGGTGLGLTISKRLVELMGGTIGVTSKRHIGSTFWFELPFAIAPDQPARASVVPCGRVIVADSSRPARAITTSYIRAAGADVDEAGSQDDLIRLCSQARTAGRPYALAVVDSAIATDGQANLIFGIERALRGAPLKVVLTTAFDSKDAARDAARDGFCALLIKPLQQAAIADCLLTCAAATAPVPIPPPSTVPSLSITTAAEHSVAPGCGHALLVEDNPVNQRVGRKQLEKLGYRVTCADNGRIAVEAVGRNAYDIVFMDLQMPEMDGLTATRAIRRNELGTGRRVPIVALTADVRNNDRMECLASGMDDFLAKPVALPDLRAALGRWTKIPV